MTTSIINKGKVKCFFETYAQQRGQTKLKLGAAANSYFEPYNAIVRGTDRIECPKNCRILIAIRIG